MLLIAFTNGQKLPRESEVLNEFLPWIDALHIRRDEELPMREWKETIEDLDEHHRNKLWLHDHFDLAVEYKLGGIHLSRSALSKIKGLGVYAAMHGLKASISCHDLDSLEHAAELYEQVFLCPVFDSISKAGHSGAFDLDQIKHALTAEFDAEIIALGGVTAARIGQLRELGFDGMAVLGSLWNEDDPVSYLKEMHLKCTLRNVN